MANSDVPAYRHLKSLAGLSQIAAFASGVAVVTFLITHSLVFRSIYLSPRAELIKFL